jgi:hypothetical protein
MEKGASFLLQIDGRGRGLLGPGCASNKHAKFARAASALAKRRVSPAIIPSA